MLIAAFLLYPLSFLLYPSLVVYPDPVIQHRYLVLLQISGGRSFHRITAVVKDVLGSADFAGGNRITAWDDPALPRICFDDTEFSPFVRATGVVGKVLHVADADSDQSGISFRRKGHGIPRYHQVVVVDEGNIFINFCIGHKVILVVRAGQKGNGQSNKQQMIKWPENQ